MLGFSKFNAVQTLTKMGGQAMAYKPEDEKVVIEKKIEKLKKRITNLNEAIALQANKIADTMTLVVISRDENILLNRIQKKKQAIEELTSLRRELLPSRKETSA
jgi:transcription initiation factor IIF auxiliary subunit